MTIPTKENTEGESAPALPPGARAIASLRAERITEDTPAAPRRGGRACTAPRGHARQREGIPFALRSGLSSHRTR
jgi:hypothetical protein